MEDLPAFQVLKEEEGQVEKRTRGVERWSRGMWWREMSWLVGQTGGAREARMDGVGYMKKNELWHEVPTSSASEQGVVSVKCGDATEGLVEKPEVMMHARGQGIPRRR